MKAVAACLLVVLAASAAPAIAQPAGDPIDRLRACSSLPDAERLKCLDKLSREVAPASAQPPAASGASTAISESWIFSETTSPIDYSPVVVATGTANGAPDGAGMKLSIACRGGTMSVALAGPGIVAPGDTYIVSYAVDGGPPTALAVAPSATGIALAGDAVRLLFALPAQGDLAFRVLGRQGGASEGHYSLAGLKATRERMAVSCKGAAKPDTIRK